MVHVVGDELQRCGVCSPPWRKASGWNDNQVRRQPWRPTADATGYRLGQAMQFMHAYSSGGGIVQQGWEVGQQRTGTAGRRDNLDKRTTEGG